MALVGGGLGYWLLRTIGKDGKASKMDGSDYAGRSKVEILLGPAFWQEIAGKIVIDFGCGDGLEAIEIAHRGASKVIGIDLRESVLERARHAAALAQVSQKCIFATSPPELADVIVSLDSFEHFADPAGVLDVMARYLKPGGSVWASFGPTWLHPRGGHLFSVFPWAHLIFTEAALIRWRSDFKTDGATRFGEVEGGLNQMTIARFEQLVAASPFRLATLTLVPIRIARPFWNKRTREFLTSVVQCRLIRKCD